MVKQRGSASFQVQTSPFLIYLKNINSICFVSKVFSHSRSSFTVVRNLDFKCEPNNPRLTIDLKIRLTTRHLRVHFTVKSSWSPTPSSGLHEVHWVFLGSVRCHWPAYLVSYSATHFWLTFASSLNAVVCFWNLNLNSHLPVCLQRVSLRTRAANVEAFGFHCTPLPKSCPECSEAAPWVALSRLVWANAGHPNSSICRTEHHSRTTWISEWHCAAEIWICKKKTKYPPLVHVRFSYAMWRPFTEGANCFVFAVYVRFRL